MFINIFDGRSLTRLLLSLRFVFFVVLLEIEFFHASFDSSTEPALLHVHIHHDCLALCASPRDPTRNYEN